MLLLSKLLATIVRVVNGDEVDDEDDQDDFEDDDEDEVVVVPVPVPVAACGCSEEEALTPSGVPHRLLLLLLELLSTRLLLQLPSALLLTVFLGSIETIAFGCLVTT